MSIDEINRGTKNQNPYPLEKGKQPGQTNLQSKFYESMEESSSKLHQRRTPTVFQASATLSTNTLKNAAKNIKNKVTDFFQKPSKNYIYLASNEAIASREATSASRDATSNELHADVSKFGRRLQETHNDYIQEELMRLGGEKIALKTPDEVQLDAMYLDASKFRECLKNADAKLTNYSMDIEGKKYQLQGISLPKGAETSEVLNALKSLKGIARMEDELQHPGGGWTAIDDGKNVLLVRSEEVPGRFERHHPFMKFDRSRFVLKDLSAFKVTKESQPIDDKAPASGTVVISSGGAGLYEYDDSEALSFLFRNMNVVLFNFRGYGKSEGVPTESGFKIDMESAYQLAKTKSGQENNKILFKALCLSGGPAAYVASKHSGTNLFLDQSYASFRQLCKDVVEKLIYDFFGTHKHSTIKKEILARFIAMCLSSIANFFVNFMTPDYQVTKYLGKIEGHKALLYAKDDEIISIDHLEENLKMLAKTSKLHSTTVFMVPGEHNINTLKVEASMQDYFEKLANIPPEKLQRIEDSLKETIQNIEKLKADSEAKKKTEKIKNEVEKVESKMLILDQEFDEEKLISVLEDGVSKMTDTISSLHVDIDMETLIKKEKVAQKQISHFLEKSKLSDDLIKPSRKLSPEQR